VVRDFKTAEYLTESKAAIPVLNVELLDDINKY
jgi:hypothetical protein